MAKKFYLKMLPAPDIFHPHKLAGTLQISSIYGTQSQTGLPFLL
jgi:hypothetical protein